MADDVRISGINWRETFPFTNLFRAFRIAIHPSKLALGLVALICLYVGGRTLDAIWPVRHLAVPNEPLLYAEYGSRGLAEKRAEARGEIEENYAQQLASPTWHVVPDIDKARAAARDGQYTREMTDAVVASRDQRVRDADAAMKARIDAANQNSDRAQRNAAIATAKADHDATLRMAYAEADEQLAPTRAIKGEGIFKELFEYETYQVVGVVNGVRDGNWLGGLRSDSPQGVIKSVFNFFAVGPLWLGFHHPVYFILFGLLFLTVWAIFGGAIARIAAVHVARDEKLSVRAALSFSASKFLSFVSAPLIPIIIIGLVGLVPLIAGVLSSIPYVGPIFYLLMSALFFILLVAGFIMTIVLIGLVAGLNLMYPTIAVEGSDSFDAISRSFSYVYARPWRMIWYTGVAVVYGALCYLFVRFFIYLMLALTHRFVGIGMWKATAPSTDPLWPVMWRGPSVTGTLSYQPGFTALRWDQALAAGLIAFWVYLLISVLGAFAISFYFTANTIIYYLMRREVDATEMDDVYLEQSDEDFAESAPVVAPLGGTTVVVTKDQTIAQAEAGGGTPADVPPSAPMDQGPGADST